jgi:hypothetical protein
MAVATVRLGLTWSGFFNPAALWVLDDAPRIGFCDPPIYAVDRPIEMDSS